jgi:hypothetical protein
LARRAHIQPEVLADGVDDLYSPGIAGEGGDDLKRRGIGGWNRCYGAIEDRWFVE